MNNTTRILKKWTLITFTIGLVLSTISWQATNEQVTSFTGAAGVLVLVVTAVMAFIWKQEIDKASGRKNNSSNES
ncbi:hypothetical protein [Glutamicibacter ardleyensis]|uniref:hypothetical protein n=1 Tax=Glutamicibacter ardleyensis TaxID=225894 RepID=UPI003FD69528